MWQFLSGVQEKVMLGCFQDVVLQLPEVNGHDLDDLKYSGKFIVVLSNFGL